ncbi:midasin-like [Papaver somniferum]|uniref:midasin-like n=1 Tax=Papaver somniferum TaxID=3469 RepID=UPI000E6F6BBA|nr:midasin-like [Papaver somniferum]
MFYQEVAFVADDWTDVHRKYDDRRSFHRFLRLLEKTGLDKYALNEDIISIINQPNRRLSLEASPDDVAANECYGGSLLLIQLMQRIRSESGDDFKREQAGLLESFLDHLIKIQQEQRFVAYSFSEHLEQLRKSDAVDDDGDRHKCPFILSEHTLDSYMWQQKHIFDSLYIMSRESAWLLKKFKNSHKILDIILVFMSKFKKTKESLDQYLLDECCRLNEHQIQLVMKNNEILDDFGGCIKNLQEKVVERKSVAEMLLGCFVDVVNMYYNRAERGYLPGDTYSFLQCSFSEAAKKTSEMINEAVEKLISVRHSDLTAGGSPLGCIALWRILFESSLINLRMDHICKNYSETVKLGVKPLDTATNNQLDQIRLSINKLLIVGESVLVEFIAMHKTVAEVSYMLGDAFTTGGAHPGTSSKHVDHLMDFSLDDFPWDKHTIRDYFKIDLDGHRTWKWIQANPDYLEWDAGGLRGDI